MAYRAWLIIRGVLLLGPWLIHLFFADVLLSALLPFSFILPRQAYDLASHVAYSVWYGIQCIFVRANNACIHVSGLEEGLPQAGESAIVVANHISWTDFYLIQDIAIRAGMLGRCRWFAKQQLKWVPFLGWGLWALRMPLVSRRWVDDRRELDRLFKSTIQNQLPVWLISFSEATRFTSKKRLEAEAWCQQHGKRLGSHLLFPRTKGFVASVQKLRQSTHIRAVYDLTIAYVHSSRDKVTRTRTLELHRAPTFLQSIFRPRIDNNWQLYIHFDRFEIKDLPLDDAGLARWLETRWVEKGQRLEAIYSQASAGDVRDGKS